ncbi:MAG: exosortase [Verrucomicrobia bacterium]|jgi:exosortase C (VPDSG-CTERM-specific)|nr:exosortase [Verrucomicrobiota bacterium]OQC63748.1 MAG: Transmembrane exosortase (Exosortase_EpsH) [Verrucomicrobia bacterium ADurb.Bin006]MDI9381790.1 exosortase/archaeosortase family protein [Verrucomicrobiota bacterium]NMD21849.1 exosortase [Verrucomicrobiota bacterium]HOA61638.1 exosortase/archaeosortase family protein [Verrucomicrobiota bacterium]
MTSGTAQRRVGPACRSLGAGRGHGLQSGGWRGFAVCGALVTLAFAWPLWDLGRFALRSDLFSHVFVIPLISGYLIWKRLDSASLPQSTRSAWAFVPAAFSLFLLALYWTVLRSRGPLPQVDVLSLMTAAYLGLMLACALGCLGTGIVRALCFPITFLAFMIPWPTAMIDAVEIGLQHASAEAAAVLLAMSGTPFVRDGKVFDLPGITLQVAQECSGIRSSYVLSITAVLGGYVLLRTGWRRWVLALAVIPLGIVRNGFRILTISMLCVHVSPEMIDSPIHRRGGPVFFVLSLIPFFLLLLWLRKTERRRKAEGPDASPPIGQQQPPCSRSGETPYSMRAAASLPTCHS